MAQEMSVALVDRCFEKQNLPQELSTKRRYRALLRAFPRCLPDATPIYVSVIYVDPHEIRSLNAAYRNQRRITDVLSFAYTTPDGRLSEGEILICPAQALRQHHRFRTSVVQEFARLFFHGLLHIYGYDHHTQAQRKQMRSVEQCLMKHAIL